jgi:glycosyltransferase involved in cell wall biosynthesis
VRDALRILFVSFYFRPDLCAGSFRATPLVEALSRAMPAGSHIDVMTTQPNRYGSYTAACPEVEQADGVRIHRARLPQHESGMLDQSKAFIAFARATILQVRGRQYDLVIATSSRLMTAVLGAWLARRHRARLYLDIRDIFVDTIKDVLPRKATWAIKPLMSSLEKFAISRADKVNLVSAGFEPYFSSRYPGQKFSHFTNGIDDEFLAAAPASSSEPFPSEPERPISVLYAGNLGEGQGLHAIVPELARCMGKKIHFRIIGDGGRKRALQNALTATNADNVELVAPMSRTQLLEAYQSADVLFLHLNDHEAFKKVLPSKLFEYAALGKPVWAGVGGYAAQFVRSEISNSAVFDPCDAKAAVNAFASLRLDTQPRKEFLAKYGRANISRDMAADILSVAHNRA